MFLWYESRGREVARGSWAFLPSIVNISCADRPCFSSSDKCLFCWAVFFHQAISECLKWVGLLCMGTLYCIHVVGRWNWQSACCMELRYYPILQLHLLSLVRVLDIKITRSLPSPSLCQPQTLSEPYASYRSTIPQQVKSHETSLALGILPLLS